MDIHEMDRLLLAGLTAPSRDDVERAEMLEYTTRQAGWRSDRERRYAEAQTRFALSRAESRQWRIAQCRNETFRAVRSALARLDAPADFISGPWDDHDARLRLIHRNLPALIAWQRGGDGYNPSEDDVAEAVARMAAVGLTPPPCCG